MSILRKKLLEPYLVLGVMDKYGEKSRDLLVDIDPLRALFCIMNFVAVSCSVVIAAGFFAGTCGLIGC